MDLIWAKISVPEAAGAMLVVSEKGRHLIAKDCARHRHAGDQARIDFHPVADCHKRYAHGAKRCIGGTRKERYDAADQKPTARKEDGVKICSP